jgi:hypothetical protein
MFGKNIIPYKKLNYIKIHKIFVIKYGLARGSFDGVITK